MQPYARAPALLTTRINSGRARTAAVRFIRETTDRACPAHRSRSPSRLCTHVGKPAERARRIRRCRKLRKDAATLSDVFAYALVEATLRRPLHRIPTPLALQLFVHAMHLGEMSVAWPLAICTPDSAAKLAIPERLASSPHSPPRFQELRTEVRVAYPTTKAAVLPTQAVRATLAGYISGIGQGGKKYHLWEALSLIAREQPEPGALRDIVDIAGNRIDRSFERAFARHDVGLFLRPPDGRTARLAMCFIEAGVSVLPAPVVAQLEAVGDKDKDKDRAAAVLACTRPETATAFVDSLRTAAKQDAQQRWLRWLVEFGDDAIRAAAFAWHDPDLVARLAAEHALRAQDASTFKSAFDVVVQKLALPPARYELHRLAALGAPTPEHGDWLAAHRNRVRR